MLAEIEKELRRQRRGIQGADANPSRYLKENQIAWLISQAKKAERYEKTMKEAIDSINREAFRTACNELEDALK